MFPLFSFWNCNYMYFRYLPFIAIELIVNFLYFLFYSGSFHLYSKSVILSLDGSNLLLKLCVKLFVLVFVLFILESTWIFLWFLVLFWNFQFFILFSRVYWHSNSKNLVLFLYCLNAPWDIYIIFLNFPGLASCTLITTYVLIFLVKLQMQILNYKKFAAWKIREVTWDKTILSHIFLMRLKVPRYTAHLTQSGTEMIQSWATVFSRASVTFSLVLGCKPKQIRAGLLESQSIALKLHLLLSYSGESLETSAQFVGPLVISTTVWNP